MKSLIIFFCTFLICAAAWAQNIDSPNRNIPLKILNKKGRPVRNIVAQSLITGKGGITDRSGQFIFEDMADNDTISIKITRNGQINIPVTGMDSIVVMAQSAKLYSYIDSQGQSVNVEVSLLARSNIVDVEALLKTKSYSSLASLLNEEVPGMLSRGPTTIHAGTEPLVVMDGSDIGTLDEADYIVDVHSIKTLEWQKNGVGWGARGTNGVILITTK